MNPNFVQPSSMKFSLASDAQENNSLPTTPQAVNMPQKSDNRGFAGWLEDNASTIGGTLGGIGGAIAGGAIDVGSLGLAAPLVNPVTLGIAGATAGGGGAQAIANQFEDKNKQKNPLVEGAESGAFQLAGEGLGRFVGKPIMDLVGKGLDTAGGKYLISQAKGLTAGLAAKASDVFGTMGKYGASNIDKFSGLADSVLPALENGKHAALEDIGANVNAGDLMNKVKSALTTNSLRKTDQQTLLNLYNEQLNTLKGRNGSLLDVPARDVYDMAQKFGQVANSSLGNKSLQEVDTIALNKFNAAKQIQNSLRFMIDDAANGRPLNPAIKEQVTKELSEAGVDNKTLQQDIANATSYNDITKLESHFLGAKQMADQTKTSFIKGLFSKTGGNLSHIVPETALGVMGLMHGIPEAMLLPMLETNTAKSIIGPATQKAAEMVGNGASKLGENLADKGIVRGTATAAARQTIPRAIGTTANGMVTPPTQLSSQSSPGSVSSLISNAIASSIPQQPQVSQGLPIVNTPQEYQALLQSVGQRGVENYLNLQRQEMPQFTQEQQNQWLENQNAVNEVQQFAQNFEKTWGGGAIAGPLQELGTNLPFIQNLPGEANLKAYNDAKGDLAQTLGKILGGGRASNASVQQMMNELPDINDAPPAAAMKLSNIVKLLSQNMNTIMSAPSTNVPGIANFSGQTVPGTQSFSLGF